MWLAIRDKFNNHAGKISIGCFILVGVGISVMATAPLSLPIIASIAGVTLVVCTIGGAASNAWLQQSDRAQQKIEATALIAQKLEQQQDEKLKALLAQNLTQIVLPTITPVPLDPPSEVEVVQNSQVNLQWQQGIEQQIENVDKQQKLDTKLIMNSLRSVQQTQLRQQDMLNKQQQTMLDMQRQLLSTPALPPATVTPSSTNAPR